MDTNQNIDNEEAEISQEKKIEELKPKNPIDPETLKPVQNDSEDVNSSQPEVIVSQIQTIEVSFDSPDNGQTNDTEKCLVVNCKSIENVKCMDKQSLDRLIESCEQSISDKNIHLLDQGHKSESEVNRATMSEQSSSSPNGVTLTNGVTDDVMNTEAHQSGFGEKDVDFKSSNSECKDIEMMDIDGQNKNVGEEDCPMLMAEKQTSENVTNNNEDKDGSETYSDPPVLLSEPPVLDVIDMNSDEKKDVNDEGDFGDVQNEETDVMKAKKDKRTADMAPLLNVVESEDSFELEKSGNVMSKECDGISETVEMKKDQQNLVIDIDKYEKTVLADVKRIGKPIDKGETQTYLESDEKKQMVRSEDAQGEMGKDKEDKLDYIVINLDDDETDSPEYAEIEKSDEREQIDSGVEESPLNKIKKSDSKLSEPKSETNLKKDDSSSSLADSKNESLETVNLNVNSSCSLLQYRFNAKISSKKIDKVKLEKSEDLNNKTDEDKSEKKLPSLKKEAKNGHTGSHGSENKIKFEVKCSDSNDSDLSKSSNSDKGFFATAHDFLSEFTKFVSAKKECDQEKKVKEPRKPSAKRKRKSLSNIKKDAPKGRKRYKSAAAMMEHKDLEDELFELTGKRTAVRTVRSRKAFVESETETPEESESTNLAENLTNDHIKSSEACSKFKRSYSCDVTSSSESQVDSLSDSLDPDKLYDLRPKRKKKVFHYINCKCCKHFPADSETDYFPVEHFMKNQSFVERLRAKVCKLFQVLFPELEYPPNFREHTHSVEKLMDQVIAVISDKSIDSPHDETGFLIEVVLCQSPRQCLKQLCKKTTRLISTLLPDVTIDEDKDYNFSTISALLDEIILSNNSTT